MSSDRDKIKDALRRLRGLGFVARMCVKERPDTMIKKIPEETESFVVVNVSWDDSLSRDWRRFDGDNNIQNPIEVLWKGNRNIAEQVFIEEGLRVRRMDAQVGTGITLLPRRER